MTDTREIALDLLLAAERGEAHSHELLDMALKKYAYLSKADRAFLSVLVHGSAERRMSIDYVIDLYSSVKHQKLKPLIRALLRLSVYQILYMDRVPDSAVCNEAVKLAGKRGFSGLKGFVNGLLRNIARNKAGIVYPTPALEYSVPEWIYTLFAENYSEAESRRILEMSLQRNDLSIRVNTSRTSLERIKNILEEKGILVRPSNLFPELLYISGFDSLDALEPVRSGLAYIQEAGSVLALKLAGIEEGDTVIDVCASPGGKSIHAADLLEGSGRVLAFDLSERKIERLRSNIERSGFTNIRAEEADARICREELRQSADLLIADLPCSGLGVIGRKPDIKYHMSPGLCAQLSRLQREILNNVCRYVKKGGRLLFSTCTLNPEENEENVRIFLKEHMDFKAVDFFAALPASLQRESAREGCIQILPGDDAGFCSGGFFISLFERV